MIIANKKRNVPKSLMWRMDQDYIGKLTPEQKAWNEQFNLEYYLAKDLKSPGALHPQAKKDELHAALYAAESDAVTATPKLQQKVKKHKSRYSPLDYPTETKLSSSKKVEVD